MRKSGLMKKVAVLGLTVAMALGTMVTGSAAGKTWKFTVNDGTAKEAVPTGSDWVVIKETVYSKELGYGLNVVPEKDAGVYTMQASAKEELAGAMVGLDVDVTSDIYAGICRAAYADKNGTDLVFTMDLPAGTYKVTCYAGGISSNNTYDTNKIYINGELVDKAMTNGGPKDGKVVYKVEDLAFEKTVTLIEAGKVEVKAANPKVDNAETGKTDGGRAYFNAVIIEEVAATASTDNVPKTGVVSVAAICGAVALAGAGVAVVTRKKED